jgi:hypothetical protein
MTLISILVCQTEGFHQTCLMGDFCQTRLIRDFYLLLSHLKMSSIRIRQLTYFCEKEDRGDLDDTKCIYRMTFCVIEITAVFSSEKSSIRIRQHVYFCVHKNRRFLSNTFDRRFLSNVFDRRFPSNTFDGRFLSNTFDKSLTEISHQTRLMGDFCQTRLIRDFHQTHLIGDFCQTHLMGDSHRTCQSIVLTIISVYHTDYYDSL